jgi:DNA-binding response OmpR family regulator
MMKSAILIVDDDELFRRSLACSLEWNGYQVHTEHNAEDAFRFARINKSDLVLLDVCLPGMDGFEAIHTFQMIGASVIFLTAKRRSIDEALGLRLGAVDYVTKPYDLDVLLARISNALRQGRNSKVRSHSKKIRTKNLLIDPDAHAVILDGKELELSPREFALLYTLAANPNKVLSTNDLLASVWGAEFIGRPQVVYTHIRWLRKKIEPVPSRPRFIVTVRGVGYKFLAPEIEG